MLKISPSVLAMYFYYECPRYFMLRTSTELQKKVKGVSGVNFNESPLTRAIMQGGYIWEEEVVEKKLKGRVRTEARKKGVKTRDLVFDYPATIRELKGINSGSYLYQGTFETPDSFYQEFGIDASEVIMSPCRPDLIECNMNDGVKEFGIVDIKSSSVLKTSHKIQVTHYIQLLKHILHKEGIDAAVNQSIGKIWLNKTDVAQTYPVDTVLPHLHDFFAEKLPAFQKMEFANVPWHVNPRCEGCEFFDLCNKEARDKKTVSLIPGLSHNAKKYLNELSVNTIQDLSKFLLQENARKLLANSASLAGCERRLKSQVTSLKKNEVLPYGRSSVRMPVWEDVRIILTAESDPLTGTVYALGYNRSGGKDIFEDYKEQKYFIANSKDDVGRIFSEFNEALYCVLLQVHEYNSDHEEFTDKKSVQVYVLLDSERKLLNDLLLSKIQTAEASAEALKILFYFQSESLAEADDHPNNETTFPVLSIMSVVRELLSIPVPIGYNLKNLHDSLKPSGSKLSYKGYDYFNFQLSVGLKGDAIFTVWNEGKVDTIDKIERELKIRDMVKSDIIQGIREKLRKSDGESILFAFPPKFSFPDSAGFNRATISKMAFITKYEKMLEFIELKSARSLSKEERLENGLAFHLTALENNGKSFLVKETSFRHQLEKLFSCLLTADDDESDRSQMALNDLWYRDKWFVNKNFLGANTQIENMVTDKKGSLVIALKSTGSLQIIKGKHYLLHGRYTDFLSGRIVKHLQKLDCEEWNWINSFIDNTEKVFSKLKDSSSVLPIVSKISPKLKLTKSQSESLQHFITYNITLVWGPPGTGKTHFIAVAVLQMLEAKRQQGKKCSVYVTAFTHAAIENCLRKILEVNAKLKILRENPEVFKLKEIKSNLPSSIICLDIKELENTFEELDRFIVGGTVYEIAKLTNNDEVHFDIIVIDEASQLKVPEATIPLALGDKSSRYLIVGDDKQLPPIVKGAYPESTGENLPLHRSIFEVIRINDKRRNILCQLYENFRMNEVLCSYPAQAIYSTKYASFNTQIASQKIQMQTSLSDSSLCDFILNPEYPLTVCVMEGLSAGHDSSFEAGIIASVTQKLRKHLISGASKELFPKGIKGDTQFWREGLFIVSPHHQHIDIIKTELQTHNLKPPFFVDTVDKMQGQECDVVIVGYGISDPEKAAQESEFIYSLNRLNVAITRARAKCIVFLSRPLLSPTLDVLENETSAEGISFMLGLENFSKQGQTKNFEISKKEKISCTVHRIGFVK